jgi:hypothetical protein
MARSSTGNRAASRATDAPPVAPKGVPHAMRQAKRWIVWEYRTGGTGKREKVPLLRKWGDASRWKTFSAALAACEPGQHLGFVLGDGWVGIDVDGAWPSDNIANTVDNMRDHGRDVWSACKGAYVERSPSRTGFKAFVHFGPADAPAEPPAQQTLRELGEHVGIECYSRGRFFAVTGDTLLGCGNDPTNPKARKGWWTTLETLRGQARDRVRKIEPDGLADFKAVRKYTADLDADLRAALALLPSDDRTEWVLYGMALKAMRWHDDESAFDIWHEWSRKSSAYGGEDDCRERWEGFEPRGEVTVGTIFEHAIRAAGEAEDTMESEVAALKTRTSDTWINRAVRWLWKGYIPRGYLTLVVGETGVAKTGVAIDIAARVTRGGLFPGEESDLEFLLGDRKAGRVLYLGSEDSIAETVGPRLKAAGADETKFEVITGVMFGGKRKEFSLQDHLAAVRGFVHRYANTDTPVTMLIIDPVTAYLAGRELRRVDSNDNAQMRAILTPWLGLAEETGIAILCLTHLSKDTSRQVLHRVLGAGAFSATARSVLLVVKLEEEGPYQKALLQVKGNLPEPDKPGGFRFVTALKETGTDPDTGKPIVAVHALWQEVDPALTIDSIRGGSRGPASEFGPMFRAWVRAYFASAPHAYKPTREVKAAAIKQCGFSPAWWDMHSKEYLDKENIKGEWMCRIKVG